MRTLVLPALVLRILQTPSSQLAAEVVRTILRQRDLLQREQPTRVLQTGTVLPAGAVQTSLFLLLRTGS